MATGRQDGGDPLAAIERGEIDPVYCLCGAERYLVDRALAAIRKAVLDPRTAGFNHDVYELREAGMTTVLNAARTMPMMAKRRLVVGKGVDEVKPEQLEPVVVYAQDPNPSTCLVLVGDKVDARFRAFIALRKLGYLHEWKPLPDRELPGFILREAKLRGIPFDTDAAGALAEIAGSDLGRLVQAIEQLALYVGAAPAAAAGGTRAPGKPSQPGRSVKLEDVETLIAETRQRGVFELTRAIGSGDREGALRLLANMLANREPPLRIQFMLARQLRQIWRAKELSAQGASRNDIASAVGISPYFLDDVMVPARQMSTRALERGFTRLYDADKTLKSSRNEPEILLSKLVQALAEDARPTRR